MVHVALDALPQAARALYPDGLALSEGNVVDVAHRLYEAGIRWFDLDRLATPYERAVLAAIVRELEVARKLRLDRARLHEQIVAIDTEYDRDRLRCVLLVLALRDLRRYERARDW